MSRPKIPSQRKAYSELKGRINQYTILVQNVYDELAKDVSVLVPRLDYNSVKPFRFSDYPRAYKVMKDLQVKFVSNLNTIIYASTAKEWKESNLIQDLVATKALRFYGAYHNDERRRVYYQTNSDALKAFQERKKNGMSLSARLWNQSADLKTEMEYAISSAVQKGISAVTLSKRLSKYLHDFPSLKADYKEKFGKAIDVKDCEYRSIRLARTEINMAYRTAEQLRWNQFDFVVGYEIKLSGAHKIVDICDDVKGKYPKDFKFVGWHPNCFCYCVPILKTEEEFWDDSDRRSKNEVIDVPDGFKKWVDNNIHRAKGWSNTPYFIQDNHKFIREDFKTDVYNEIEKAFVRKRRTKLAMSRVEYYNSVYPNIPEVQQAAVNAYTQAVSESNKGATSREINRRLRNGSVDEYVDIASSLISKALAKLPKYEGIVFRGETMSIKQLKERFLDHVGDVVSDNGFFSSSKYLDAPKKFISHDGVPKSHRRVIFEIRSKNGRDISKISEFNGIFVDENQYEVLFDKRTKFLIKDCKIEDSGIHKIILIEQ